MAEAVRDSIIVQSEPDRIYDVIANFAAYPEWQDETDTADILETDEGGRGRRVRFALDARIVRVTFVLSYTYEDRAMRWTLIESDQLRRNDGSYELADRGDGATEVVYSLEVEPTVALPGILKRKMAKRIVDGALRGMKARVESLG